METDDKSLVYNINLCRICQVPNDSELVSTSSVVQDGKTCLEMLAFIFKDIIWIEDELISLACTICLQKIVEVAEFKRLCLSTNSRRDNVNTIIQPKLENDPLKVEALPENDEAVDHDIQMNWFDAEPEIPDVVENTSTEAQQTKKQPAKRKRRTVTKISMKTKSNAKVKVGRAPRKTKCLKCDICGETFNATDQLQRHVFRHNGTRNYICIICGRKYITQGDLGQHLQLHSAGYTHACDMCPKKFKTTSNLKTHKNIVHTDPKNFKHLCTFCGRKFSSAPGLNEHLNRHNQIRNFHCTICKKTFVAKGDMLNHIITHSNDRPFKCDLCPAEYKRRHSLHVHKTEAHNIGNYKVPKVTKKMYDCTYCGKSIAFKDKFERHVRTHTGMKPYQCRRCDTKFACKSYIKPHLKKKHDINIDLRGDTDATEFYIVLDLPAQNDMSV